MCRRIGIVSLLLLGLVALVRAEEKPRSEPVQVPYRLTIPKHLLVRAKVNGKGPFHFILDTGAPAMFLSTAAAKRAGVTPDRNGWTTFDRVEIEGGVVVEKVSARIEDPFQLESMNGMGLAGVELHGILGYNVLARYRIEIDFTRDTLGWTPLDWEPKAPAGLGGRGGSAGGLEVIGTVMKTLGNLLGRKASPHLAPRGFLGLEIEDGEERPNVKTVLAGSPAARAEVRPGDVIHQVQGRTVVNSDDVRRILKRLRPGDEVKLTLQRGKESVETSLVAGEGL
jgi:hypothetical protein